ncbi:MAG TPA: potassium-transporting ATPase subunit KdpA, partial [Solirubrobacteraceae bacterium]|nr:potassium-transporting ATPase subunit KdpA [Solirubrobacteraceae bacterium]
MTVLGWVLIFGFAALLTILSLPLGRYMAAVYGGDRTVLDPVLGPVERGLYRVMRANPAQSQDWKAYARSLIVFSLAGWLLLYLILRTQTLWNFTGLNPQGFHS